MQPVVLSHSAGVFVVWLLEFFLNGHKTKTPAEGKSITGCMYNLDLLMMGLWGLKYVEERGNPDTLYRRKRVVYQVGNKDKINLVFFRVVLTAYGYFIGICQRQIFRSLSTDNVIGVMDNITGDVAYSALDIDQYDLADDIKGF
jgi:hypothetical protein